MNESVTSVVVTSESRDALRKTRPWVLFLGIMSIIGAVLIGLDARLSGLAVAGLSAADQMTAAGVAARNMYMVFIATFAFEILIFVLFAIFHLRYAGAIRRSLAAAGSGQTALDEALAAQRNFWVLMGIVMLVGVGFSIFTAIAGFHLPDSVTTFPH